MLQWLNHRPPFRRTVDPCRIEDADELDTDNDLSVILGELFRDTQGIWGKRLPTMDREH